MQQHHYITADTPRIERGRRYSTPSYTGGNLTVIALSVATDNIVTCIIDMTRHRNWRGALSLLRHATELTEIA